jgi:hypothetical protein
MSNPDPLTRHFGQWMPDHRPKDDPQGSVHMIIDGAEGLLGAAPPTLDTDETEGTARRAEGCDGGDDRMTKRRPPEHETGRRVDGASSEFCLFRL